MSPQHGALIVEPCAHCGRDQTIVRTTSGDLIPTCICCGGGPLARDRYCPHFQPQRELGLPKA